MRLKTLRIYFMVVYALLNLNKAAQAQCPGGVAPQQISQNTTASIDGDAESFPFDQFDPSLGTLIGVDIHANISGLIAMTVINYNTNPRAYNVQVFRKDTLKSPGLGVQLVVDTTVTYTTTTLPGSLHPGTPPFYFDRYPNTPPEPLNYESRYVAAPINRDVYQTITNPVTLAGYSGPGSINIDYTLDPGFALTGSASQAQGIITTYATNIDLTLTYTYCPHAVLASGKLNFQADKKSDKNVLLTWTKEKEQSNILYTPEVSFNSHDFTGIGTMQSQQPASDATVVKYEYGYDIPSNAGNRLYFRVKQVSPSGEISYSAIRVIDLVDADKIPLSVYPNPADKEVQLVFNKPQKNALQVELISSVGQVVETRGINLNGAQRYTLDFTKKHASGVYFMRVFNATTKEQQLVRLVIR